MYRPAKVYENVFISSGGFLRFFFLNSFFTNLIFTAQLIFLLRKFTSKFAWHIRLGTLICIGLEDSR